MDIGQCEDSTVETCSSTYRAALPVRPAASSSGSGSHVVVSHSRQTAHRQIGALDPGRSITLRSSQGGVTADYVYTCTPYGDGTRVSLVADCRMTGPVRLLSPMIRSAIRRAESGQLDAFAATFTPE